MENEYKKYKEQKLVIFSINVNQKKHKSGK